MNSQSRWKYAQRAEREYWSGVAVADQEIRRILADNRASADRLQRLIQNSPKVCLEVGVGGLGVGVIGFLSGFPVRIGIDPMPPVALRCSEALRTLIHSLRGSVHCVVGAGESIPVGDESVDLVVCCNVLDHVRDIDAVLTEIRRILRPGTFLFLEVDTFSASSLIKWHCWTKRVHGDEILVRAHPYRFLERDVLALLRRHSFEVVHRSGRSLLSAVFGRSRPSMFLAMRR